MVNKGEKTYDEKPYELKDVMAKLDQMENSFKMELKNISDIVQIHETSISDHDFKINHLSEISLDLEKSQNLQNCKFARSTRQAQENC